MPAAADYAVTLKPIKSIRPYEKNPRTIPPEAIDAVANSITMFGFQQPIVVDDAGVIIVGHTRWRAALKLNLKNVPVHVAEGLTPEQVQAYRIADNSSNSLSTWDLEMLHLELSDLPQFNFADFGLDLSEVEPHRVAMEDEFDVDLAVANVKVPKTKRGDVWLCGPHRVMCGDSTVPGDMAKLVGDSLADCVWTDPPYNVDYVGKTKDKLTIQNDVMSTEQFDEFLGKVFAVAFESTKPGGIVYVAHADSSGEQFRRAFRQSGWMLKQCLIWVKDVFVMGRQDYQWQHEPILYGWKPGKAHGWYTDRRQTTVLQFDRPKRSEAHPTMKPVALVGYCMGNSSRKGNVVLDMFGGSGTTLVAAEQLGREARLMELDPIYCDVIVTRWEQLTGQKATR